MRRLLAAVFAWLALACGPEAGGEAAPDAGGADVAGVLDAADEQACLAQGGECVTTNWSVATGCVTTAKEGAFCGVGTVAACKGRCGANGQCSYPGSGTAVYPTACTAAACDGKGGTQAVKTLEGQPCDLGWSPCAGIGICSKDGTCQLPASAVGQVCQGQVKDQCLSAQGACTITGSCEQIVKVGGACSDAASGCKGTCAADGSCEFGPAGAGYVCKGAVKDDCVSAQGVCTITGECKQAIIVGGACGNGDAGCAGVCDDKGACSFPPANCVPAGSECAAGNCNSKGVCVAVGAVPSGTPCSLPGKPSCLVTGAQCDGTGKCVPVPGAAVGGPCKLDGPNQCSDPSGLGTCMADGKCKALIQVGKVCKADWSNDCSASSGLGKCSAEGYCKPDAEVGKACTSGNGQCSAGVCGDSGYCNAITGTPCTQGDTNSACSKGVCADFGVCVSTMAGQPCNYGCKTGVCGAIGWCSTETASPNAPEGTACKLPDYSDKTCVEDAGQCSATGNCVGKPKPKGTPCNSNDSYYYGCTDSGPSTCDGAGHCTVQYFPEGSSCVISAFTSGPCTKPYGVCAKNHSCAPQIDVGASCTFGGDGDCTGGVCDTSGKCVTAAEGKACSVKSPDCGPGTCGANGYCLVSGAGKPCKLDAKWECHTAEGLCSPFGSCYAVPLPAGSPCSKAAAPGPCETEAMACNGTGSCARIPKPFGAIPTGGSTSTGPCASDLCDGKGGKTAAASAGNDCTVASGPCAGSKGVCSSELTCLPTGACVAPAQPTSCGDFAKGIGCHKAYVLTSPAPPYYTSCSASWPNYTPFATNSGNCGSDGDPCRPKVCNGSYGKDFACLAVDLADGTPCPDIASEPCSAAVCSSGKCNNAKKPEGSACTPKTGNFCAAHACSAKGECLPTAAPAPAPCLVGDGDSDCWAKLCDAQGVCQKAPRTAGSPCGAEPASGCLARACDGLGACKANAKPGGTCERKECSAITAQIGTACAPGSCWYGTCVSLGQCGNAKPMPAGEVCWTDVFAGNCDGSGSCVLKGNGSAALTGKLCLGAFPCLKEDVVYGADGVCHGTIATGAACGSVCNPGVCSADGTCKTAATAKGTVCGPANGPCGDRVCDGKGECVGQDSKVGTVCSSYKPDPCHNYTCSSKGFCEVSANAGASCTSTECTAGVCSADGYCVQVPKVGQPCPSDNPCAKGTCSADGTCTTAPLTGTECPMPGLCAKGICQAGVCTWAPTVGKTCGETAWCHTPTCNAKGECESVLTPGAPCPASDTCHKGVCTADGQCTSVQLPEGTTCGTGASTVIGQCQSATCDAKGQCVSATAADGSACHVGCWPGTCTAGKCAGIKGMSGESALCSTSVCMDSVCCSGDPKDWDSSCYGKAQGVCADKPTYASDCAKDPCHASSCYSTGQCKVQLKNYCDGFTVDPKNPPDYCDGWAKCATGSCYFCVLPNSGDNPYCSILAKENSKCEDDNPCTQQSCWPAKCAISPVSDGAPCGAFRKCKGGNCALVP